MAKAPPPPKPSETQKPPLVGGKPIRNIQEPKNPIKASSEENITPKRT